jgi:hypothetical protein
VSARIRRSKPYVCVDCDFADHFRFQATTDLDSAAGAWLRCLAHSRAQEQDGRVTLAWLRRNFPTTFARIEELVAVGLLRMRADGDYEIHAYAPRNQTRAMMDVDRWEARKRMRASRKRGTVRGSPTLPSSPVSQDPREAVEGASAVEEMSSQTEGLDEEDAVTANKRACSDRAVRRNSAVTSALVPTSTSISSSSSSSDLPNVTEIQSSHEGEAGEGSRGEAGGGPLAEHGGVGRRPLPRSERPLSGPAWLEAFTVGIAAHTGRPCTAGRMYLATLERVVTHHALKRDAPSACAWLREQAQAFARQWDGKHPPKGLTPDGLERWLNEGRQGPPEFGKPRIVQLPAEEWHEDDWSDLGATVLK